MAVFSKFYRQPMELFFSLLDFKKSTLGDYCPSILIAFCINNSKLRDASIYTANVMHNFQNR